MRSFLLEFCNITTGEVQAVADGKEISVLTDDNGRLTVCLEQVLPGTVYEILVTFEDEAQKKERRPSVRPSPACRPATTQRTTCMTGCARLTGRPTGH